ncbi:MAG TPA: fatty acid desaturase [Rhizomicrobium sp.]|nr:fatty acid desaturase [Rhizomicrobium sp.]
MTLAATLWAIGLFVYYGLPLALLPLSPWFALLLIPAILTTTTNWALMHEAIHNNFHPDGRINNAFGRINGILFGAPYETLKFGHLLHHSINGTPPDRPEYFEPAKQSRLAASLIFYPRLMFGLYAVEVIGAFAVFLPRSVLQKKLTPLFPSESGEDRATRYLLDPRRLTQIRIDAAITIALIALAFWCYGAAWPLLALAILARGVLISFADNGYHYEAPIGQGARAAYNLRLAGGAAILNFNLHQVHHRHPNLPWRALPAAFAADQDTYDGKYFRTMARQLRGPVDYSTLN